MPNSTLLRLRWWQIRKECKGIGLVYVLLLLLLVLVIAAWLYGWYSKSGQHASWASAAVALSVLAVQIGRKDKVFVAKHMAGGFRNIAVEYISLTLPFTFPLLLTAQWWLFIPLQAAFIVIAKIKAEPKQQVRFRFLAAWITPCDFEWLSGTRKNLVVLVVCYLAAWGLCWMRIAPLAGLWLITLTIISFYIECEPLHILKADNKAPAVFLRARMLRQGTLLAVVFVPVLVLNTLFCPGMLWINLAFLCTQALLLCFALLLKYAVYRPDVVLSGNNLLLGFMALSVLVPFLLPLPLLLSIRNYRRAVVNLKGYYHDQHEGY